MAEYLIQENTLTDIADAIRSKTGSEEPIPVGVMAEQIAGITTSGVISFEEDMTKYVVYQLDDKNKEIVVYGILYEQLYADTGSYDVNIPDKFGDYQVVLVSEGVS